MKHFTLYQRRNVCCWKRVLQKISILNTDLLAHNWCLLYQKKIIIIILDAHWTLVLLFTSLWIFPFFLPVKIISYMWILMLTIFKSSFIIPINVEFSPFSQILAVKISSYMWILILPKIIVFFYTQIRFNWKWIK